MKSLRPRQIYRKISEDLFKRISFKRKFRRGYHAMLTDVFSPCLVRLKINFSGMPVISSLYILWAGRICPCVWRTWVVPSTHRRRATEVQTRTPPYGHVAGGTANARWRYREGTAPVRRTCLRCGIFCVWFGASEARRPQETCVAGTVAAESLSDPNQPQETQNLKRNSAAAPDTQEP